MKTRVLQEDLLKGLSIVSRFVSSRAQLPILSNILISAENSGIKLAATNLETGIVFRLGAKTEEEGAITVPVKTIVELVAGLSNGPILLQATEEQLRLENQLAKVRLSGILATEFPSIPDKLEKADLDIKAQVFLSIKDQVVFSASDDEARPVLTGVLLSFSKGKVQAVSSDGFRLSCKEISADYLKDEHKLLVPAKLIEEISKINGDKQNNIQISILDKTKQILFLVGDCVLTGRLLEGEFPNFEKIIPKRYSYKAVAAREELLKAVRVIGVIARESLNIAKIRLKKDEILLFAQNQQYGEEEVKVEAKVEGEETEIAFNYRFLLDFLNSVRGTEISFETEGPSSPCVFRDTKDNNYFHLIMPVRLQD